MTSGAAPARAPLSPRLIAALAALVVLLGAIANITPDPIGVFWDDGVYLLTAKALAAGDGYRYTYLPGMPPAIHYPPGFPLLLAVLLKVTPAFPANVAVLKLLNPVCLAVGVFGTVRLGARSLGLGDVPAAVATVICALTAPVLVLSNVLLSEPFFFAVLVASLRLLEVAVERGGTRAAVFAGVSVALVTLVRTVGGVLLPAAVVALWWKGRRREAVLSLVAAVGLLAPWQLWVWSASRGFPDELRGSYGPYLEWVVAGYRADPALAWRVVAFNAGELMRAFSLVFAPRLPQVVQWSVALLVILALVGGLVALARRTPALVLFVLAYGGVVLLWPYNPERFVWCVWPLAGVVLLAALRSASAWGARQWAHAPRVAMAVGLLMFGGHAMYAVRGLAEGWGGAPQRGMTERLWPLVQWTVTHAGTHDIVASDGHVMIALYTGRITMPVSMLTPAEHLQEKPAVQYAHELAALATRYQPTLLVLSRGTPETEALPNLLLIPAAPRLVPLAPVPGGGAAFAVRAHD